LRVLDHTRFRAGSVDTGFLDSQDDNLAHAMPHDVPPHVMAAVTAHREFSESLVRFESRIANPDSRPSTGSGRPERIEGQDPWQAFKGWR